MSERLIAAIAARGRRGFDQPYLAERTTVELAWGAWTPIEGLLELPREAEDLIDQASAELAHHVTGERRRHAWRCDEAAAWGLARPLPQLLIGFHRLGHVRRERM